VPMLGHYLDAALPSNAVLVAGLQSGAVAFYTGRPVIRFDMIHPGRLDRLIDDLTRAGYRPAVVIDEAMEGSSFREPRPDSTYGRLDWPARAESWSHSPLLLLEPGDRAAYLNGEPYPTDILTSGGAAPSRPSWSAALPRQGITMPPLHESLAFRRALDAFYRDRLARPPAVSAVRAEEAVRFLQRYLRYRIYGCGHDEALSRVFAQIDGHLVAPVCGRIEAVMMPPRDHAVDFRRRLEARLRTSRDLATSPLYVDLEGEAIWMQEYLRFRLSGCSTADATTRVFREIEGLPPLPACSG
jgi:hypothetical protein